MSWYFQSWMHLFGKWKSNRLNVTAIITHDDMCVPSRPVYGSRLDSIGTKTFASCIQDDSNIRLVFVHYTTDRLLARKTRLHPDTDRIAIIVNDLSTTKIDPCSYLSLIHYESTDRLSRTNWPTSPLLLYCLLLTPSLRKSEMTDRREDKCWDWMTWSDWKKRSE